MGLPRAEPHITDEHAGPPHIQVVSKPKINQFDRVAGQFYHHVLGLEVAVQVVYAVELLERGDHVVGDEGDRLYAELLVALFE